MHRDRGAQGGHHDRLGPDVQPRRHRHVGAAHQDQEAPAPTRCCLWTAGKEARRSSRSAEAPGHHDADLRRLGQGPDGVHHGRRRRCRGLRLRHGQEPAAGELGHRHRGVQGRRRASSTRYKAAYGAAPNTFAGHAYDALYLIAERGQARHAATPTPAALARRDREDSGSRRHRRDVHLLADGPQRSDGEGPDAVRGQERHVGDRSVAARLGPGRRSPSRSVGLAT